jgi:hypothetical protein
VLLDIEVFWDVTPCCLADIYWQFCWSNVDCSNIKAKSLKFDVRREIRSTLFKKQGCLSHTPEHSWMNGCEFQNVFILVGSFVPSLLFLDRPLVGVGRKKAVWTQSINGDAHTIITVGLFVIINPLKTKRISFI